MKHDVVVVIHLLLMVTLIVCLDVLFLRDRFWWRLGVNAGIVAVFIAVYPAFFRSSK